MAQVCSEAWITKDGHLLLDHFEDRQVLLKAPNALIRIRMRITQTEMLLRNVEAGFQFTAGRCGDGQATHD